MSTIAFMHCVERARTAPIVPLFLPFSGCPRRCIYCAQDLQSGTSTGVRLAATLQRGTEMLEQRARRGLPPAEAAFYGGTFTGQSAGDLAACLEAASGWLARGLIRSWRCSTRPDAVSESILARLSNAGCETVELGIQSFSPDVLAAAGRGVSARTNREGMALVRASGMRLGAQLLPGLPHSTPEGFLDDVRESIALGACLLRFYPCLVLRGTGLAALWQKGRYTPLTVEEAVRLLAEGLLLAGAVPVTRIGVAYDEALSRDVLAGPWDPQLGERVRSLALVLDIERHIPQGARIAAIRIPKKLQGLLYGPSGMHKKRLAALGITGSTVSWTAEREITAVI